MSPTAFAVPKLPTADRYRSHEDERPRELTADDFAVMAADGRSVPEPGPAPTFAPPGLPSPRTGDEISERRAISGQKVTALWSNSANLNSWFYLATAGWKRADPTNSSGCHNLTLLAASARQTGAAPLVTEGASGIVTSMYVW